MECLLGITHADHLLLKSSMAYLVCIIQHSAAGPVSLSLSRETQLKPSQEPCRFCGKTFPTWKRLTVHLSKHMEHISLPVLELVEAKQIDPETIISPVHDPPPNAFGQFAVRPMAL